MMKTLLAGVAAIAMVASAAAQTMDDTNNNNGGGGEELGYECSVTKVTPPEKDKDPGYKINVYFVLDGKQPLFSRVIHTTRSGAQYSRVNQYNVANDGNFVNKNGANVWIGESIKDHGIYMVGTFGTTKDGKLVYVEDLWRSKNKKLVMSIDSVCHRA